MIRGARDTHWSQNQQGGAGLYLKGQPTSPGEQGMGESAIWRWEECAGREGGMGGVPGFVTLKFGVYIWEGLFLIFSSLWFCTNSRVKDSNRLDEASVYLATDLKRHFLINNSSLSICYSWCLKTSHCFLIKMIFSQVPG